MPLGPGGMGQPLMLTQTPWAGGNYGAVPNGNVPFGQYPVNPVPGYGNY